MTDVQALQAYRARALQLHEELRERLATLQVLRRELKRRPNQDLHELARVDKVSVAIEHLEQSMAALESASRE